MFERGPQGRSVRSLVWQNQDDDERRMPQRQGDVGRRSNLIVKVQTMMGDGYYFMTMAKTTIDGFYLKTDKK
jgi:hypothetical protein